MAAEVNVVAGVRIAWKPAGGSFLPGSRLRAYLPAEHLREAGWQAGIFDPRVQDSYDVVIFQKIYDREALALARRLTSRGTRLVFDLCDNHFYGDPGVASVRDRVQRLQEMIDLVDAVSVSTLEMSRLIRKERVTVIDDPIDYPETSWMLRAQLRAAQFLKGDRRSRVRFVWHGTAGQADPPTGLIDVGRVLPHLEDLNRTVPLSLTVISNSRELFEKYVGGTSFPTRYVPWKLSTFPYHLKQNDICLIPISVNPFTICKTNNRLVSSLLLGLPVVADSITSYEEFAGCVLFGNWRENLHRYAADPALRREHVREAQRYIRSRYTPSRVVSQWSAFLAQVLVPAPENGAGLVGVPAGNGDEK